ncbi:hypothetical protein EVAR_67783_1 [Eumeta japonica]|uniref:Uncharacterized protein n=1 Tax=Eumeta variegata TaxID=151549 RepID=A0A4C1ZZF8_EUMVA|nr:hypothetical protein EVAR_67783_1 [Eumeta japonica]
MKDIAYDDVNIAISKVEKSYSVKVKVEKDFIKADSANLPKVDSFMIANFFASNPDFCSAEFRNVKTSVRVMSKATVCARALLPPALAKREPAGHVVCGSDARRTRGCRYSDCCCSSWARGAEGRGLLLVVLTSDESSDEFFSRIKPFTSCIEKHVESSLLRVFTESVTTLVSVALRSN